MFKRLKNLFTNNPTPMNTITINKNAILNNYKTFQAYKPDHAIFPVVKSNAYGHGLEQICKILEKTDAPYICVDSFPEYQIVKDFTSKKILLIGETRYKNYKHFDIKRTTFCVHNIESIHYLGKISKKKNKKISIHLFVNTGMNREGIQYNDLINILETLKNYPKLNVEGILSHFYDADDRKSEKYLTQIEKFKEAYYEINKYGHSPKYRHISATAGILRNNDPFFNSARLGLGLYGYSPFKVPPYEGGHPSKAREGGKIADIQKFLNKLQPALTITSQLISKQTIGKQEGVSYNHTFINTNENTLIGTIPFGYMEGIPRNASNKILFKYQKDKKYTIRQIGNICMNLSSCLLEKEHIKKNIKIYDKIILIDKNYTLENWARNAEMSIYEVLVKLDRNIRREIE